MRNVHRTMARRVRHGAITAQMVARMVREGGTVLGALRDAYDRLYEAVIKRDPLYRPAFNNLVFRYMQTRSLDRAEGLLRRVERITGESPNIVFARGTLALASGQLAKAVEQLERAHALHSRRPRLWRRHHATLPAGDHRRGRWLSPRGRVGGSRGGSLGTGGHPELGGVPLPACR